MSVERPLRPGIPVYNVKARRVKEKNARSFRCSRSSDSEKAAAAYALVAVYQKTGKPIEQIRCALWLHTRARERDIYFDVVVLGFFKKVGFQGRQS